jgi:hypothetical protein
MVLLGFGVCAGAFCQQAAIRVPLQDILKTPDQYHGKLIETRGFLLQQFENSALYTTDKWQGTSGIWITPVSDLHIERAKVNRHYMVVTGIFDANDHGHLGQFKGTLKIKSVAVEESDKSGHRPKEK